MNKKIKVTVIAILSLIFILNLTIKIDSSNNYKLVLCSSKIHATEPIGGDYDQYEASELKPDGTYCCKWTGKKTDYCNSVAPKC
jgi:hypothetical protein